MTKLPDLIKIQAKYVIYLNACSYFRNMKRKIPQISILILLIVPVLVFSFRRPDRSFTKLSKNADQSDHWAMTKLSNMTLEEKIGQFFMIAAYSNQGEKHLAEVEQSVRNNKLGGIIFFQGEKENLQKAINRFQTSSKTPLFIGMDAEWGTNMRLFDGERFPYAYTLGAADDLELSKEIAQMMALECRELGIHMNFSPVADVHANPNNPVIGFRSFGESPKLVADHVKQFVIEFERNGIMSCVKHFPGHGNTEKDSHKELPTVSSTKKELEAIDLFPFRESIRIGASSVMVGHLNVPALDPSGTPASLSKKIIKEYLQHEMGFSGLVISDALNMDAVAKKYGKTEVVVKAFEAGCDILLFPESVEEAIASIAQKVKNGTISKKEIDERCLKILKHKHKFVVKPGGYKEFTPAKKEMLKQSVFNAAITVLKNEENSFPIRKLDTKIARVSIGMHTAGFRDAIQAYADVDHFHYFNVEDAIAGFKNKAQHYDYIISAFHANTVRPKDRFGLGSDWDDFFELLPQNKKNALVIFGNPLALRNVKGLDKFKTIVAAYENNQYAQTSVAQILFGAAPAIGKLPFTINEQFKRESGEQVAWGGRLQFSSPEALSIDPQILKKIDKIALNSIQKKAFPGCQILVAVKGKIIYRKSFGKHTYESADSVKNNDLYDIASVSKIAGSTLGIMFLQSQGKFNLGNTIGDYLPGWTHKNNYDKIVLKEMMAHQAGLPAWIPFYKRTLSKGELKPEIYTNKKQKGFETHVANNIWIMNSYSDSIYEQILSVPLGAKKYEYSDLGYYFIKKIIEKQSAEKMDDFLYENLYAPMGLRRICYNPLNHFDKTSIVPTENDQVFRKQVVHGYVHDPGAAMLGGVGGHAGLFANATDLAGLMQLFLNKGMYGNHRYVNENVVDEYTRAQFYGNRRGCGFDRPLANGGGSCFVGASQLSFGHSGFTGTLVWADPKEEINYVFLSNRVYPDQDNWKIRDMNIRTEIQGVIYEAVLAAKGLKIYP